MAKRLQALASDGLLAEDVFDKALGSIGPLWPESREHLLGALADEGIEVRPAPAQQSTDAKPLVGQNPETSQSVKAARQLLESDRRRTRPDRRLLTAEEEVGLSLLLRAGIAADKPLPSGYRAGLASKSEAARAFDAMVLHNQRLVWSIARNVTVQGMDLEDVAQFGMVGLIRAVEMFDPSRGFKFSTYATHWIRQAIDRGVMNTDRLVRLPVHMAEKVRKALAVGEALRAEGRAASSQAIAERMEASADEVEYWQLLAAGVVYLDTPLDTDGDTLGEVIDLRASLDRGDEVFDPVLYVLLQEELQQVLDSLSEREAGVIAMRFGLTDGEPKTLDEIGKVYGVTRERIRQIEKKTMARLSHPSRSQVLRGYL